MNLKRIILRYFIKTKSIGVLIDNYWRSSSINNSNDSSHPKVWWEKSSELVSKLQGALIFWNRSYSNKIRSWINKKSLFYHWVTSRVFIRFKEVGTIWVQIRGHHQLHLLDGDCDRAIIRSMANFLLDMMEQSGLWTHSLGKRNNTIIENEKKYSPVSTGRQPLVNGCWALFTCPRELSQMTCDSYWPSTDRFNKATNCC